MKGWIAGTLLATLTAAIVGTGTIAQEEPPDPTPEPATETTANVEVRVWQDVRDARSIYISARPEDGVMYNGVHAADCRSRGHVRGRLRACGARLQ